jgi:predicted acyl esterase
MLAARIWLPDDAEQQPGSCDPRVSAIPYRKRDATYERDALTRALPV